MRFSRSTSLVIAAPILLAIFGCSDRQSSSEPGSPSATDSFTASPFEVGVERPTDPDFDASGNRIYTGAELEEVPAGHYRNFPIRIAQLMRHADIEDSWCRGASGGYPETLRACNRREILHGKVEKLGFCWGSEKSDPAAFEYHWLKCLDQPDYNPNSAFRQPDLYSEADIAMAERQIALDAAAKAKPR